METAVLDLDIDFRKTFQEIDKTTAVITAAIMIGALKVIPEIDAVPCSAQTVAISEPRTLIVEHFSQHVFILKSPY